MRHASEEALEGALDDVVEEYQLALSKVCPLGKIDAVWTSPKKRAVETAQKMVALLGLDLKVEEHDTLDEGYSYEKPLSNLVDELNKSEAKTILLVTHLPNLNEWFLVGMMGNAGVLPLAFDGRKFHDL